MKNQLTTILFILFLSGLPNADCHAEVRLPAIVSSSMVLQRNARINLWGWASAGEKLVITASWQNQPVKITASGAGEWKAEVQTTGSKEPQTIRIKSTGLDIFLPNILFGEVWLCSGQSNMEQPVMGHFEQPTIGAQMAVATTNNSKLRLFTVEKQADISPKSELEGYIGWQSANPESVKEFSAIVYFFGQHLQEILDVPAGMIHTSWGGSLIEAWISAEMLGSLEKFDIANADLTRGNRFPTVLFNAMINPLIPYTIKGVLWYQGEANASQPEKYKMLFPAMVKDWRTRWGIGDFPFYYVQIAPYAYGWEGTGNLVPLMREAQVQCLDLIPNSGIAITLDVGEEKIIHPAKKIEVADRLLYNALNQTYGMEAVDFSGPVVDSVIQLDERIRLFLSMQSMELTAPIHWKGLKLPDPIRSITPQSL